ncbi:RES domain-containing protein [bacterium]|nr:RES domain-containing protein [bacterium]
MSESCSIITEKYGELFFSKITGNISDIVEQADNENIIPILMEKSYSEELNTNFKKEDIDFYSFPEDEQNDFYEKFLSMQSQDYKSLSGCESVQKAIEKASIFKAACSPAIESAMKSMQVFKAASNPIIGSAIKSMQEGSAIASLKLTGPKFPVFPNWGMQMPNILQTTGIFEEMNKLSSVLATTNYFVENSYSSLFDALESFKEFQGNYVVKIDESTASLFDQVKAITTSLKIPSETFTSLSYIPNYYSVSKISRDEAGYIDVYIKNSQDENESEYLLNNIRYDYGFMQFINDIPEADVLRFLTHLQNFPYLALLDELGREIFDAVQAKITDCTITLSDQIFYRARARKNGDRNWTPNEMGPVQYGVPIMGRFNFLGKPYFYVATDEETARKEVENNEYPASTVMKLKQKKDMTVFDISAETCPLITYCNAEKDPGNNFTAYLIPNFIADCCAYLNKNKSHSVDAIKFKSNKNGMGCCYVILDDEGRSSFFDKGEIILPNN